MLNFKAIISATLLFTAEIHAANYQIDTLPKGASVYDLSSNKLIGVSPIVVDVSDNVEGQSYGVLLGGYEKIVIGFMNLKQGEKALAKQVDVDITTQALPGKAPNRVIVDKDRNYVGVELRPVQSIKLAVPY